jgi:hypothetical protein
VYLFTGISPRWQQFSWLPDGLHIMYSAGGAWNNRKKEWRAMVYPRNAGKRWLDCGGFTLLNKYGDYPFTVANYANLVAATRPTFYATMDYPCEPNINRTMALRDNRQRIKATVDMAAQLMAMGPMIDTGTAVPVLQGYTLDEYLYCLELYHRRGLVRPYMAVGSMCKRSNDVEILDLLPPIYEAAVSAGVKRLHLFGLKLSDVLKPLHGMIWSRDSAAVLFAPDAATKRRWGGRRWARGQKEKRYAFEYFWNNAEQLGLLYC